jgi:hypothetical protein
MLGGIDPGWDVDRFEPGQLKFVLVKNRPATLSIKPVLAGLRQDLHLQIKRSKIQPEMIQAEVRGNEWKDTVLATSPIDLSGITAPGTYTFAGQLILPAAVRYNHGADQISVRVQVEVSNSSRAPAQPKHEPVSAPKPQPVP